MPRRIRSAAILALVIFLVVPTGTAPTSRTSDPGLPASGGASCHWFGFGWVCGTAEAPSCYGGTVNANYYTNGLLLVDYKIRWSHVNADGEVASDKVVHEDRGPGSGFVFFGNSPTEVVHPSTVQIEVLARSNLASGPTQWTEIASATAHCDVPA